MRSYEFSKFSPCCNFTVFLHGPSPSAGKRAQLCGLALRAMGGEQAGFADIEAGTMLMAGGEFCVNATRAFGALLDMHSGHELNPAPERRYEAAVSGLDGPARLAVSGLMPIFHVEAEFEIPEPAIVRHGAAAVIVHLPGISHLLLRTGEIPGRETAIAAAHDLLDDAGLLEKPAAGVVWWKERGCDFEILPFVRAPSAGTAMIENSCGSASLALAMASGAGRRRVFQPCGESLEAGFENGQAVVGGDIWLMARGEIWL